MSLNKVMLIGNVGKDPEVRYLDGAGQNGAGRKVATFTLATSERYRDRSGESRENTEWHNIVAWGQPADIVERFVKKGTQLYIEGRLRTRSWTDKNGGTRYTTEINVDNLQLLGRRDSQGEGGAREKEDTSRAATSTEVTSRTAEATNRTAISRAVISRTATRSPTSRPWSPHSPRQPPTTRPTTSRSEQGRRHRPMT